MVDRKAATLRPVAIKLADKVEARRIIVGGLEVLRLIETIGMSELNLLGEDLVRSATDARGRLEERVITAAGREATASGGEAATAGRREALGRSTTHHDRSSHRDRSAHGDRGRLAAAHQHDGLRTRLLSHNGRDGSRDRRNGRTTLNRVEVKISLRRLVDSPVSIALVSMCN